MFSDRFCTPTDEESRSCDRAISTTRMLFIGHIVHLSKTFLFDNILRTALSFESSGGQRPACHAPIQGSSARSSRPFTLVIDEGSCCLGCHVCSVHVPTSLTRSSPFGYRASCCVHGSSLTENLKIVFVMNVKMKRVKANKDLACGWRLSISGAGRSE